MVRRILTYIFIVCIISFYFVPVFAVDNLQSESDTFGFQFDNSSIYFTNKELSGYLIDVDNQIIEPSKLYFYIPVSSPPEKLEFRVGMLGLNCATTLTACDYGEIYSNSYHIIGSMTLPSWSWLGMSSINGSNAKYYSFTSRFNSFPFSDFNSYRYIRLTIDAQSSGSIRLVNYLRKNLDQNLSGVLGNPTYTFSGTEGNTTGQMTSGSLSCSGYYITGSLKSMYYNGSSTSTFTGSLLNGTTGTGGYLHVPAHNLTSNASSPLKFSIAGGNITGSLTPSSASQNTDLEGIIDSRTYTNTVTMSATRSYNDADLIQAVNDASDRNHTDITNFSNRNHTDLVNIGNDLQELVDHQDQVNQAGNNIGSTTSSSSISNTSGNLSSGVSGLNSTLSTASDVSSFVTASTPYISFIGAFLPVVLNFGNGVLAWAVVAIIAVTVFLYILKKVSE